VVVVCLIALAFANLVHFLHKEQPTNKLQMTLMGFKWASHPPCRNFWGQSWEMRWWGNNYLRFQVVHLAVDDLDLCWLGQ
jgi:hypothetical protein